MSKHYFISEFGDIYCVEDLHMDYEHVKKLKSVRNYFNSVEEADKALGIKILSYDIINMKFKNITYEWRENGGRYENPCTYKFNISIELFGGVFLQEILDKIFRKNSK